MTDDFATERKMYLDIIRAQNETIKVLSEKQDGLASLSTILGPVIQMFLKNSAAAGAGAGPFPFGTPPFESHASDRLYNLENIFDKDKAQPQPSEEFKAKMKEAMDRKKLAETEMSPEDKDKDKERAKAEKKELNKDSSL